MNIQMVKFGKLLNGRPAAREAYLRMVQIINGNGDYESITLNFSGVEILTPSFADELLRSLNEKYMKENVKVTNAETEAVKATLKTVQIGLEEKDQI